MAEVFEGHLVRRMRDLREEVIQRVPLVHVTVAFDVSFRAQFLELFQRILLWVDVFREWPRCLVLPVDDLLDLRPERSLVVDVVSKLTVEPRREEETVLSVTVTLLVAFAALNRSDCLLPDLACRLRRR